MPLAPSNKLSPTGSIYIYIAVLLVCLAIPFIYDHNSAPSLSSFRQAPISDSTSHHSTTMSNSIHPPRMPVYFLSIGGPNFIDDQTHPAYIQLAKVGRKITSMAKPKAVVVFSAHWQDGPNRVSINVAEKADLIYDFYGFPEHYYEVGFPNKGSPEVAEKVIGKLERAGIEVKRVERGLDHGVWAGFVAAFDPKTNPLNVPIVQVSLFGNENLQQHYRLGQAMETLRDEGMLIIGAGMAVHNLRDFRATRGTGRTTPYAFSFDNALKEAATSKPEHREMEMLKLIQRSDVRQAHPTLEHLLPMYVAAGAAGADLGEQLWTLPEGSMSWAQYRFGKVA